MLFVSLHVFAEFKSTVRVEIDFLPGHRNIRDDDRLEDRGRRGRDSHDNTPKILLHPLNIDKAIIAPTLGSNCKRQVANSMRNAMHYLQ